MNYVRISGREYPERPPLRSGNGNAERRLRSIVESLKYACSQCSEMDRRLYKNLLEALAHAENAADLARAQKLPDPELCDLQRHALEH